MPRANVGAVECYSGHTYAQEPRAFVIGSVRRAVTAVLARWREPKGPVFAVSANDGCAYQLGYDEAADTWTVSRTDWCLDTATAPESQCKGGDQG
jgi:hypothetical protein